MFSVDNNWFIDLLNRYDVNIWVVDLCQLEPVLSDYWKTLSVDEKEKALSFKMIDLQNRYATSRGVLRRLLSCYLNIPATDIKFTYNPQDKPEIGSSQRVFFNLSHSRNIGLIAVSKRAEVGIDLEFIDYSVDIDSLSKIVMTKEEQEVFNSLSKDKKIEAFYVNWTRKEAFVKCLGLGLQFDLKKCSVGFGESVKIRIKEELKQTVKDWFIKDVDLAGEPFKAAIVLKNTLDARVCLKYYKH